MTRRPLLLIGLVLAACSKERPATAEEPRAPTAAIAQNAVAPSPSSAPAAAAEPAIAPASVPAPVAPDTALVATVSEANFELRIQPKGPCDVAKPAQVEIVLDAKAPFHVNDKYPYKFKLKDEAGLKFAAAVVGKDAVALEKMRATMSVPFTAETAGAHTVAGQFSFSLCTDDKCLIEKRDLALRVEAK
jgi:hypothetical protein